MNRLVAAVAVLVASTPATAQSVTARRGRIVVRPAGGGSERELTASGRDTLPVLSPDGRLVAFVRDTPGDSVSTGSGDCARTEIWVVGADGAGARRLVRGRDADDMRHVLACLWRPSFSPDGRAVYFLSAAWATSSALHRVDAATGREAFVCDANAYEWVARGRHAGDLLVWQHRYYPESARDGVWLVTPACRTVRRVAFEADAGAEARIAAARAGRLP